MIVITLSKVPASLRGDLTKWCQKVQTGIYVGNFNSKIRDLLWDRICKNIGYGEATLIYSTNNELGYQFKTTRHDKEVVDFDGIPLMKELFEDHSGLIKHGFSNAAKYHRAKIAQKSMNRQLFPNMVGIDLETTGKVFGKDKILSIGAVKRNNDGTLDSFYRLINVKQKIPDKIVELTGITNGILEKDGIDLETAINEFKAFIGNATIVGYNVTFDFNFLSNAINKLGHPNINNKVKDVTPVVKKDNMFLDNYQLETVLKEYKIENKNPHNALEDATATLKLAEKLLEKGIFKV